MKWMVIKAQAYDNIYRYFWYLILNKIFRHIISWNGRVTSLYIYRYFWYLILNEVFDIDYFMDGNIWWHHQFRSLYVYRYFWYLILNQIFGHHFMERRADIINIQAYMFLDTLDTWYSMVFGHRYRGIKQEMEFTVQCIPHLAVVAHM